MLYHSNTLRLKKTELEITRISRIDAFRPKMRGCPAGFGSDVRARLFDAPNIIRSVRATFGQDFSTLPNVICSVRATFD